MWNDLVRGSPEYILGLFVGTILALCVLALRDRARSRFVDAIVWIAIAGSAVFLFMAFTGLI